MLHPPLDLDGSAGPTSGVRALLAELGGRGVRLRVEGDALKASAPKGALNDRLKTAIRDHKAALVDLLSATDAANSALPPLEARPISDRDRSHPLSFAQRRLWVLDRLTEGENPFYNVPIALTLDGRLERAALEQSFQALANRHPQLRARFVEEMGDVWISVDATPSPIVHHDLTDRPATEHEAAARAICEEAVRRPFALTREAPARVLLIRLRVDRHILLINTHHIISDGWTMAVLVRDFSALYAALCEGRADPLPPLTVDYGDFAIWQRGWLSGERLENQFAFWHRTLVDAPQTLPLPCDRPRPKEASYRGGVVPTALPTDLSDRLRRYAERTGTTPFMVLMTAFQVLLGRLSGRTDLVVGTPIANRRLPVLEDVVGFFANTLAFRGRWDDHDGFADLLSRTRTQALDAYHHQDLPFEVLVERLNPERALDRMPLVQAVFALQNTPQRDLSLPGLVVTGRTLDFGAVRFDLELHLWDQPGEPLGGSWIYATDLFDRPTVERWARCFVTLLDAALAAPDTAVGRLPLLTEAESRAALRQPTLDLSLPPKPATVHAAFAVQATARPSAGAVTFEGVTLTYRAIDRASDRLAMRLAAAGVTPGDAIAVALSRGLGWPVAILAAWKVGGHFVPVDPDYPTARQQFLIRDSGATALITEEDDASTVGGAPFAVLTLSPSDLTDAPVALPFCPAAVGLEATAYIIYTSGTTGTPKGVPVTHGNVLRLFEGAKAHVDLGPDQVWSVTHAFAFDFSVWELWGALLQGGRAVIAPGWVSRSPSDLIALLEAERVTHLSQTPTAFRHLAAAEAERGPKRLSALHTVVFGGEALNPASLMPWVARYGLDHPVLVNMYGITETTVHVTHHRVTHDDLERPGSPIGHPLSHLGVAVMDAHGAPVPDGAVGEIWVWGDGVAPGYLNQPGLTEARFVSAPDGFPGLAYRSGDLGRWRNDGVLEHLGRLDEQLSIRGYRIEPAEVETALIDDPSVKTAVAVATDIGARDRQLIAYAVPSEATKEAGPVAAWATTLRERLAARLPAHLVPARIIAVPDLPLTANGKLDRAGLPPPDRAPAPAGASDPHDHAPPQTERERMIATVWAEVLDLPSVGRDENFFELGGDSILAIMVVARLGRLGINTTTRILFLNQTVATLAEAAESNSIPLPDQTPLAGPIEPTPIQRWFLDQPFANPNQFNQAMGFRLSQPVGPTLITRALNRLVAHHDSLRLYRSGGGLAIAPVDRVPDVALTRVPAGDGREPAIARAQGGFDLTQAPLLCGVLVEAAETAGSDELILIAHHLVVDTVSWWILSEDLNTVLSALLTDREPVLPLKTASLSAWTTRLRADVQSETPIAERAFDAADRAYWAAAADGQHSAPLTLDGPEPTKTPTVRDVDRVTTRIPADQARRLLETLAPQWDVSAGDAIAALVCEACATVLRQRRLGVEVEGHGRSAVFDDLELTRTVGWFTALYPVTVTVDDPDRAPEAGVAAIAQQFSRIADGGLGYGVLRTWGDLPAQPSPAIRINYLGQVSGLGSRLGSTDRVIDPLSDPVPYCHGADNPLSHSLDVLAMSVGRTLTVEWIYARPHFQRSTIDAIAACFEARMAGLAQTAASGKAGSLPDDQINALGAALAAIDGDADGDPFASILDGV